MRAFGRTVGESLLTLLGVSALVFVLLRVIPGGRIEASLGTEAGVLSHAQLEALRHYYGIDQSLPHQYWSWITNLLSGNLGVVAQSGVSVASLTRDALPVTVELALLATVLGTATGVAIGIAAGMAPGRAADATGRAGAMLGLAIPNFVAASVLTTVLASRLHYFPNARDYAAPWDDLGLNLQQMLFPALVLALPIAAIALRTTRAAFLEAAAGDYVRTARGKGLPERAIAVRHILPNALIPVVTVTGIQFGYLLGGAVVVEQVFALPGLGRQILVGIQQREYAVVQSSVMIAALGFVLANLLVDALYRRIDPRTAA